MENRIEINKKKNGPKKEKKHKGPIGYKMTEEHRKNLSQSLMGFKHTEESKIKMFEGRKGKNNPMYGKEYKKLTCPHCGITTIIVNAKRWHFDNCKYKK